MKAVSLSLAKRLRAIKSERAFASASYFRGEAMSLRSMTGLRRAPHLEQKIDESLRTAAAAHGFKPVGETNHK